MSDFILFLPKNSKEVKKIPATDYEEEKALQDLIEKRLELLPLSSGRIVTLAREYPIAGGAIDLLCVDNEVKIYIVETKLRKNTDRRQAIAQLIDYAAQLGKESFEDFQAKISERTQRSLEELLKEFGEELSLSIDAIRKSLREKNFVLILSMDLFEPALKDAINYLRLDNGMNVFGIELHKHPVVDQGVDQGLVFVPEIIPPPETPSWKPISRTPATKEEVVRNYKNRGLESEINNILRVFDDEVEKRRGAVQEKFTPTTVVLDIGNRQSQLYLNKDPTKDHGVWVYNLSLYEKVFELGKLLQMNAKMSEKPVAKIIICNGEEGIRKLSSVVEKLVSGLVDISAQRAR
jgi:hypothetical protein